MLIALKSVHKAHSMSYDHGMRYTIVKIYSMGSPNGGRPTHIMYFHDVNKQIVQTLNNFRSVNRGIWWPPCLPKQTTGNILMSLVLWLTVLWRSASSPISHPGCEEEQIEDYASVES